MNCRQARKLLTHSMGANAQARRHAASCGACSRFATRLKEIDRALVAPRSEISPPPGFARRVRSRLAPTEDLIGWAALRLLPATLAVVLLLSWLNLRGESVQNAAAENPTDAVVSWMLDLNVGDGS